MSQRRSCAYCLNHLGEVSEKQDTSFMWRTPDGNVVLQLAMLGTTHMINLFETSRMVRTFTRRNKSLQDNP